MKRSQDRILLVTNTLGKWGETNGVEHTYNTLLSYFREYDIPVDVVSYGPKDSLEKSGSISTITHRPRVPVKIDPTLWVDPAVEISSTARFLTAKKYSIVHSATPDPLGWFALRMSVKSGCPLVTAYHTTVDSYAEIRMSKLFGERAGRIAGNLTSHFMEWYFNKSDLILTPSHHTKKEIARFLKPPIDILSRGIDLEKFNPKYRSRKDENVQALFVGRVSPEKNLDCLVRIFQKRTDVKLKIVGEGPYLSKMKKRFPGALYTGQLRGKRLSKAFADADFFVFPSKTDTFGNAVRQAMGSGLPVLVFDDMAPKEQVQNSVTGFVASSEDGFERSVDILAKNRELRKKMGLAAYQYVEQYTWDKIFKKLLSQYERAVELKKGMGYAAVN